MTSFLIPRAAFLAAHLGGRAEPIDFAGAKFEVSGALAACRAWRLHAQPAGRPRLGQSPIGTAGRGSATAPPSGCGDMGGDVLLISAIWDCREWDGREREPKQTGGSSWIRMSPRPVR